MPESVSLAAERAAEALRHFIGHVTGIGATQALALLDALDDARVLLQAYEVAEQDIREQVAGTAHEQPIEIVGPDFLRVVFESMRVAIVEAAVREQEAEKP